MFAFTMALMLAAIFCLIATGVYGTTEYVENILPIQHHLLRTEIINQNQDINQAKLLVNNARFFTQTRSDQQPALMQMSLPDGISEDLLFRNIDFNSFTQGYGNDKGGKTERIDEAVQILPTLEETRSGNDQTFDHALPDMNTGNRVDNTKEIHTYTEQKKIVTQNNRNLHRYLKNLNVNTQYNTNIQKVAHSKLNNLLINNLQETHQPKLLVKYSRQDTTQDLGVRNEAPIVENERKDNRMPDVFVPAVAERIGYDGQALPVKTEVVAEEADDLPLISSSGQVDTEAPRGRLNPQMNDAVGGNGKVQQYPGVTIRTVAPNKPTAPSTIHKSSKKTATVKKITKEKKQQTERTANARTKKHVGGNTNGAKQ